jgi:nicotinamide-nucleotide amidase
MRAEIISCGTELLLGHITDTNATYLAQSLASLGIDLYFVSQVGDNQRRIVETLRRAWERSDLVIITGGLGPTEDDLARESISAMLGETMLVDPVLEAELRGMFATRNSVMPERNIKQATLIPSARAIANPLGTAPGWWVEKDGHIIVAMPGVPREILERYGAISEETARAMAHAVRESLGVDYGLGITGVVGPDKEEDKPAGTVHIAIEGPGGVISGVGPGWRASRDDNKRLAVLAALNLLRLFLEGVKKGQ